MYVHIFKGIGMAWWMNGRHGYLTGNILHCMKNTQNKLRLVQWRLLTSLFHWNIMPNVFKCKSLYQQKKFKMVNKNVLFFFSSRDWHVGWCPGPSCRTTLWPDASKSQRTSLSGFMVQTRWRRGTYLQVRRNSSCLLMFY